MVLFLKRHISIYRNKAKLNEENQLLFIERLYRLLQDGYPLVQALKAIEWNEELISSARLMKAELMNGKYIDEAFQAAKFHHTVVSYMYFVRFNHDLTASLEKALHMFKQRVENKKKFTRIIRYPFILSVIFIILLFFLKRNILPSFIELFQHSQDSSSTVLLSIMVIDVFVTCFIVICLITFILILGWKFYLQKLPIEDQMVWFKKMPFYRLFVRMQTSYYFTTHISMFLQTGMSMKVILQQMAEQDKLPIVAYYAKLMQRQLENGFQLGPLLMTFYFIEPQIAYIFDQQNNRDVLEKDLRAYADYMLDHLERKTKKGMMLIQPIFFIILASFIVFIYLALMWPMFQLIQTV